MIIRLTCKKTKKDEYCPVLINTETIVMMYPNNDYNTTIIFDINKYLSIDVLESLESIENIIRSQSNP